MHLAFSWEDGQRVERYLDQLDRWAMHAADEVTIEFPEVAVCLKQQPNAISATRMGVGACMWEGELVLAAYLGELASESSYF